jgi:type I restriction enzyme S subunit
MIPEGWGYRSLDELASIKRGKFSARPRNDPRYYGGSTPFVQTGDVVAAKKYLTTYSQTLNDDGVGVSKIFPPDTILITIAANIGATAITTFPVACPDSVVGINPFPKVADGEWLQVILESKQPELDAQATQNAQKNINLEVLKPLQVLTPPYLEQQLIGGVSRTWDRAIETIEALIANARAQKQALMQQLLPQGTTPPKKRLHGFSGEWREIRLGSLVKEVNRDVDWDDEATYKLISVRRRSFSLARYSLLNGGRS